MQLQPGDGVKERLQVRRGPDSCSRQPYSECNFSRHKHLDATCRGYGTITLLLVPGRQPQNGPSFSVSILEDGVASL